jgi:maleamate amidohydrolase
VTELTDDYAAHGFRGRVGFGSRPAVLVVDVVRAYLEPSSPLYAGVEAAVAAAVRLTDAARAARIPVALTSVRYARGGVDGGLWWRKVPALRVLEDGSPLAELAAGLEPRPGDITVVKQYASAFFGTSLASTLHAGGIDTLVVAGLTTSGCVRATVVDAISYGFAPIVVREAVGDRDPRPHEANLFDMDAKYADVVGLNEVLAYFEKVRG